MKKSFLPIIVSILFVLITVSNAFSAYVYWAQWDMGKMTYGEPGAATGTIKLPTGDITVTYAGELLQTNDPGNWAQYTETYTYPGIVDNAPSPATVSLQLEGGNAITNTISFSAPVWNPIMAIQSLGRTNSETKYQFNQEFTLLSEGAGHWGGGELTKDGLSLIGYEGNGIIQFTGMLSAISWTVPVGEYYHMFTVGTSAVPIPGAALLLGSALLGLVGFRRTRTV